MQLVGVVVEVLRAVGEVGAGDARRRAAAGEVVLDPHLALRRAEAALDPVELGVALDAGVTRGEEPRLRERSWTLTISTFAPSWTTTSTTPFAYASSSGSADVSSSTTVKRRAGLGDDEDAPEERPAGRGARDAEVQRLLELDPCGDVDEQPVLPDRRVVRAELVVGLRRGCRAADGRPSAPRSGSPRAPSRRTGCRSRRWSRRPRRRGRGATAPRPASSSPRPTRRGRTPRGS